MGRVREMVRGGRGEDKAGNGRNEKDAVLLQHGEAPEELQGVGRGRWAELLTGAERPKEWKWLHSVVKISSHQCGFTSGRSKSDAIFIT